jgi:hypothetical protein
MSILNGVMSLVAADSLNGSDFADAAFGIITAALPATAIPASNERREPRNPVICSMVSLFCRLARCVSFVSVWNDRGLTGGGLAREKRDW